VAGSERLRLFCALRLDDEALERVVSWQERELRGGRIVPRDNLHLTLAFLGAQDSGAVPAIAGALAAVVGEGRGPRFGLRGYRETGSVGMLTFADEGGEGAALFARLADALEQLGLYHREARPWLPHLTVLRFRVRPRLQPPLPELAEVAPSDVAVFMSRLRPGGALYDVLEAVSLKPHR
jgi:RNA 2',3'-cyclic 3'-phosphodiesterase